MYSTESVVSVSFLSVCGVAGDWPTCANPGSDSSSIIADMTIIAFFIEKSSSRLQMDFGLKGKSRKQILSSLENILYRYYRNLTISTFDNIEVLKIQLRFARELGEPQASSGKASPYEEATVQEVTPQRHVGQVDIRTGPHPGINIRARRSS
jgi:hypothetical protein